jgi:hypothetical protein
VGKERQVNPMTLVLVWGNLIGTILLVLAPEIAALAVLDIPAFGICLTAADKAEAVRLSLAGVCPMRLTKPESRPQSRRKNQLSLVSLGDNHVRWWSKYQCLRWSGQCPDWGW